jgi:hypothetical protein
MFSACSSLVRFILGPARAFSEPRPLVLTATRFSGCLFLTTGTHTTYLGRPSLVGQFPVPFLLGPWRRSGTSKPVQRPRRLLHIGEHHSQFTSKKCRPPVPKKVRLRVLWLALPMHQATAAPLPNGCLVSPRVGLRLLARKERSRAKTPYGCPCRPLWMTTHFSPPVILRMLSHLTRHSELYRCLRLARTAAPPWVRCHAVSVHLCVLMMKIRKSFRQMGSLL